MTDEEAIRARYEQAIKMGTDFLEEFISEKDSRKIREDIFSRIVFWINETNNWIKLAEEKNIDL